MPQVDWNEVQAQAFGHGRRDKKRYAGANVKFFNAYELDEKKSEEAGRAIYNEIPSISIQWPGMDETVRRIEPRDIQEYPELYSAFKASSEPVESGTPLNEWPPMNGSAMRELQYLGFKTVEQLAEATGEAIRKLGPLQRFVKLAKDWIEASSSDTAEIVKLKAQLDAERARTARLEDKLELFMQRVEANEGTDLRGERRKMIPEEALEEGEIERFDEEPEPKKRGRPRKS